METLTWVFPQTIQHLSRVMKTQQCGLRTGPTQTELYKRRRRLEAEILLIKK